MATHNGLYYETVGAGPAVYILHGGLGFDHTYLKASLEPLAQGYELVFMDLRGNGRSEEPADWDLVSHASWTEDVDRLRRHLGHAHITLLGSSYGGFLALEYAIRFQQHVSRMILAGAGLGLPAPEIMLENARQRATQEQFDALVAAFSGPIEDDNRLGEIFRSVLPIYAGADPEPLREAFEGVCYRARPFNVSLGRCLPGFDVSAFLPHVKIPTLLAVGRKDWIAPPDLTPRRLLEALPASEMVVYEDSGHFPFIEEPQAFVEGFHKWMGNT
jgi:proline iminopeptidase